MYSCKEAEEDTTLPWNSGPTIKRIMRRLNIQWPPSDCIIYFVPAAGDAMVGGWKLLAELFKTLIAQLSKSSSS